MKKLLRKRVLIPLFSAALLALAVFSVGAAFGWWTTSAAPITGNSVSTGTATLVAGGGPVSIANLVPQVAPADDPTGSLGDSAYPSVSYIYVQNQGSVPLMFYGYLANPGGDAALLNHVHIRIWLNPVNNTTGWTDTFNNTGNYLVFDGVINTLWNSSAAGKYYLGSTSGANGAGVQTPILPGQTGVYKIACWLDSSAGNDTQAKSLSFSINFNGEQQNEFIADGGWGGI